MPTPLWVTEENVKFDGTLDNAAVLEVNGDVRTLVLWDDLSAADQAVLEEVVDAYGGTLPVAGFTVASQDIVVSPAPVDGLSLTGLEALVAINSGSATIDIGGDKVAGDPSGLSTSAGTAGYQVVNYQPGIVGGDSLGIVDPTAGSQTVDFGGTIVGANATGLANDATVYTATVTIDGGAAQPVAVTGSAAQTFTTLLAELNTDVTGAEFAIVGGDLVLTSDTEGTSSTVLITDGTLFTALTGFVDINTAVAGTGVTSYTASVSIDGVAYPIVVDPLTVSTFTDLLGVINTAIGVNGTASISGGDLRITSASVGLDSKVRITVGTLFPATANYSSLFPPKDGGGAPRNYTAIVEVDGSILLPVSFDGDVPGATFTAVLSELNTDLDGYATASLSGGNLVITSDNVTGTGSSIRIYDSGFFFSSLADYAGISYVDGRDASSYTLSVKLTDDAGVETVETATVIGTDCETYDDLVAALTAEFTADIAVSAVGGLGLLLESEQTPGEGVAIEVVGGTLLKGLPGSVSVSRPRVSVDSIITVLNERRAPNGSSYLTNLPVKYVGLKPAVPPYTPHTVDFIYYDSVDEAWKYLDDDTLVNPPPAP
jgi:hypothetical protein